jgi:hypothetical protein
MWPIGLKEGCGIAVCKTPDVASHSETPGGILPGSSAVNIQGLQVFHRNFICKGLGCENLSNFAMFYVESHSNRVAHVFAKRIRSKNVQKLSSRLAYYDPSPLPCVNGLI